MNIHDTPSGSGYNRRAQTLGYYLGISRSDNIARRRDATRIFNDAVNGGEREAENVFSERDGERGGED